MATKTKEPKVLSKEELEIKAKALIEKKRIAALPDDQLTKKQLDDRIKGRKLAQARKNKQVQPPKGNAATIPTEGDFLEEPVEFFHHNTRFTDFGYTDSRGKTVTPPEGEMEKRSDGTVVHYVKFAEHFRKWINDPQGKGHIAKSACVFKTYSKKMVEYYRNHFLYNKTIFEDAHVVYKTDSSVADIMETVAIKMTGTSNSDIIAKAIAMKIPVTTDLAAMRRKILEKMAVDELTLRIKTQQALGQGAAPEGKSKGKTPVQNPY